MTASPDSPAPSPPRARPRVLVLARNGPLKGQKAAIEPGGALRVGRTDQARFVFPADRQMSALHCEITWDGQICRARDLGSIGGTRLSGEPITFAEVPDGAYLEVGDTVISVYIEGAVAPRRHHRPDPETLVLRERALSALRRETLPLHAVLDAARDDRILELLPRSGEDFQSLYEGVQGEALADVAPYLVRLPAGSRLLSDLVMEGWGEAWGVYLTWPDSMKELRRHLRRFLMVLDVETTQKMYFRYYDPRVLRVFLPTCSPLQSGELFGEIGSFLVEGERGETIRFASGGARP